MWECQIQQFRPYIKKSVHKGDKNLSIKVDDGQVIQVNKNVLTGASGVFEAMLAGQFLESNQKEVDIFQFVIICTLCTDISVEGIKQKIKMTTTA